MGCSIEQYRSAIGTYRSQGRKRWRKVLDLGGVRRSRGLWWGAVVVLVALVLNVQLHGAEDDRCIAHPIQAFISCSEPFLGLLVSIAVLHRSITHFKAPPPRPTSLAILASVSVSGHTIQKQDAKVKLLLPVSRSLHLRSCVSGISDVTQLLSSATPASPCQSDLPGGRGQAPAGSWY